MIRLQAYLAHAGVASRRESERIILAGRVSVNGIIASELGVKVDEGDAVCVDDREVHPEAHLHYIALNKPPLYLCSASDPLNRPLAGELLPRVAERLYNIGRLDFRSSGLIFFTNDGAFASKLSHPSSEIEKEYLVEATNIVPDGILNAFREGIRIEGVLYRCREIERLGAKTLRIVLIEGKNREIRTVFSSFRLHPKILRRIRIGNILLGDLAEGKTRPLSPEELKCLRAP
ncbi:MAG: rRNA pseudouridine synthase [Spirochaetaceae bacterium]|jgi:23S rRNA pseudouridine2605 synthase|nr:rRNA pseudouridine synthase [Spirochaetaceae bacterium]